MCRNGIAILLVLLAFAAERAGAEACSPSFQNQINIDLWSEKSLLSPDQQWRFVSVGPKSPDQQAILYIQYLRSDQKWKIGSIERHGTAFWSDDSKRLFLRDEFAADDTKIRIFDVSGPVPREVKRIDEGIRRAIFARIPKDETTLWLYYPQVCFAANDSSTIIVTADAPVVRKKGDSQGKSFRLKLTLNVVSLRITTSGPPAPRFP